MAKNQRDDMTEHDSGDLAASAPNTTPAPPRPDNESPDVPVFPSSEAPQQPIGTRPVGNEDNETPAMKIERERAEQDKAIADQQAEARDTTERESSPRD